jgi:type II secretory pathway pseudopilin PulG
MKQTEEAFTLMETLISVAIILILSGILVVASGSSIQGASKAIKTINTAITLSRIDRHIRIKTEAVHIPYWTDNKPYIDVLTAELYQSKFGAYIKSVKAIVNYPMPPRGIEVIYEVNSKEMRTVALFPSIAVLGIIQ